MRLHQLTVTAFGPFAGTEEVDFDQLNEAGLFLLTGPTGAGKSSLLDAVCFALYGTVPGARGTKALKSQHAPRDATPEVVLDFEVRGRRFVVRRTPEWSRPKKRGEGVMHEKASASITETTSGEEHFWSSRAAEVGLLVGDLMGMNAAQFVQVALLPQGEFQTFLRASSQDRHAVLQHLFRTDRFARIEDWVNDHSRGLRAQSEAGRSAVQRVLDSIADRAGVETPEHLTGDSLATSAAADRLFPWVQGLLEQARHDQAAAQVLRTGSLAGLEVARASHAEGLRLAERHDRVSGARRVLAGLEATGVEARAEQAALDADRRAAHVLPVLTLRASAEDALEDARRRVDRGLEGLDGVAGTAIVSTSGSRSDEELGSAEDALRLRAARLQALLPREADAERTARARDSDLSALATTEQQLREAVGLADLPARAENLRREAETVTARAARAEAVTLSLQRAREQHAAAAGLLDSDLRLRELEELRRDVRDRAQDARGHLQDLVARRLTGMAAELAATLVDGEECQVCGSLEHPRPASLGHDPVTVADQEAAEERLAERQRDLDEVTRSLHELQARRDALAATADGAGVEEAAAQVRRWEQELSEADRARRRLPGLERERRSLQVEQERWAERRLTAAAELARLQESVQAHERALAALREEIGTELDGHGGSVTEAARTVTGLLDRVAGVRSALRVQAEAAARLEALEAQAAAAADDQGFGSWREVAAHALPAHRRTELTARAAHRAAAEAGARAVLDDPELADEGDGPTSEELADLAAEVSRAEEAAGSADRTLALEQARVQALQQLLARCESAVTDWAPLRDQALRAESMSRLVRGMGGDNQLQMRLSAYVLATRLDQVVAAANERLAHLRDQRYLLQRTGRVERRGSQSGLGLEVVDQWTGDVRSPSTLSGGETFVVSLSLALGLADVVTQEAGGTEVETLFVDEGFGTLDADTLDDVMDRLDGLRAGGRTVGVVSHVTELRSRILTQVEVTKGRSGSTVSVGTLVG